MKKLLTALALLALAAPALPCEDMKPTNASHSTASKPIASAKGTAKKVRAKEKAAPTAKPAAVTD